MNFRDVAFRAAIAGLCTVALAAADQPASAAGHWVGTFSAPTEQGKQDVSLVVDLALDTAGAWTGSIDIGPLAKGLALSDITSSGGSVHFALSKTPQAPAFNGKLSPDGKSMSGDATVGGQATTFKLTRTGEAAVAEAPKSTPLSKELQGKWQGALEAGGNTLRLVLELANQSDGTGGGTLTSVDQGNTGIALSQVTQKGQAVAFNVRVIGGAFEGELNSTGTELKGQWTQGPNTLPLTLTKQQPEPLPAATK